MGGGPGGGPEACSGLHFVMSSALSGFDGVALFGLVRGKHDGVVAEKARRDSRLKERAVEVAPCRLNMRGMEWRSD